MDQSSLFPLQDKELTGARLAGAAVFDPGYDLIGHIAGIARGARGRVARFAPAEGATVDIPLSRMNFLRDRKGAVHATMVRAGAAGEASRRAAH